MSFFRDSGGPAEIPDVEILREFELALANPGAFLRTETVNGLGDYDTRNWGHRAKTLMLSALRAGRAGPAKTEAVIQAALGSIRNGKTLPGEIEAAMRAVVK